jgi:hypothetical protein
MEIGGSNSEPPAINKIGHKSALTAIVVRLIVVPVKGGLPLWRFDHFVVASDGAGSNCIED